MFLLFQFCTYCVSNNYASATNFSGCAILHISCFLCVYVNCISATTCLFGLEFMHNLQLPHIFAANLLCIIIYFVNNIFVVEEKVVDDFVYLGFV